jgi:hypothetical protein
MAPRNRIPELSGIEFTGHQSVIDYSKALREINRDLAHETEFAAEELRAVLSRQQGHPLLFGIDVRLRARKVTKRLHRASELCGGAAVEAVKFYQEFRLQFAEVITPPRRAPAQAFDWDDA